MLNKKKIKKKYILDGFYNFGKILDEKKCLELKKYINKHRPCNKKIFYKSENEFKKKGRFTNYSPGEKEHNAIYNLNLNLEFIENSKKFKNAVQSIVGKDYIIKKKSIIRSVPITMHPKWVLNVTKNVGRPNVNPYVREKYQDVQYFQNVDYHQDMTRGKKFVTFYVYLDEVSNKDSPLKILKGSYKFGATHYPHYIRPAIEKNHWYYSNLKGDHLKCEEENIFGKSGQVFCFHGLNLHGTGLNKNKSPRISLRYLIKSNKNNFSKSCHATTYKFINGKIVENIKLKNKIYFQRLDRDIKGKFLKTGTSILYNEN